MVRPGGSSRFVTRPFCELGPASTDQVLGVIGEHFDGAVRADVDVPAREGLHGSDAGWGKQANPISFRVIGVLTALGSHAVEFEDALARERLLEPVQELSGRVDLIVVPARLPIRKLVPLEFRTCGSPSPRGAGFPLNTAPEKVKSLVGAARSRTPGTAWIAGTPARQVGRQDVRTSERRVDEASVPEGVIAQPFAPQLASTIP